MGEWKETEFGPIPKNWSFIKSNEYCTKVTDGTHDSPKRQSEGKFLVTSKHLKGREIDFENAYLISHIDFEKINKRSYVEQWDVIVSMIGEYCGFTYVERNEVIDYAVKNVGLFKTGSEIKALWLHYFLNSTIGKYILDFNKNGSSQPYISLGSLRELPILIPSLSEQKSIVAVLSSLDDKIDLLHRQNDTLEAMAETLFRQWFVEEAKEDWEVKFLNEFISIKHGYAFKGHSISSEPNNQKLVTPGNFKIGGGFKSDKFRYYTGKIIPKDYIFQSNDLVITMTDLSVNGDTLGLPAFIPENYLNEMYLHNQRVGKVIYKKVINGYFLYNLMKTEDYKMYIHGSASGTSIRHTSPTSICSYSFLMPPNKLLEEYDKIVSPLYNKIIINQSQIRTLTVLRDTLLPKLMSGEVRVKN